MPFTVSDDAVTAPASVAVPAVRVNESAPVVEKPAMLGLPTVPPIVMLDALAVNVPLLVKLPFNVSA